MKVLLRSIALLAGAALGLFWVLTRPDLLAPADLPEHAADLANGELLFHAGGCAACHGTDLAGGLEMNTPFGLFRVPNISPDDATGIGNWSGLDFANAMARGVAPDGRHYYPAFPYTSYTRMPLADLLDLKAYIDTLPAVENGVAAHELGFPWNIRRGIGLWKMRYLDSAPVIPVDATDPVLARGRYLVEGAGHCAECHTPRDRLGGAIASRWLSGGPNPEGDGKVPNISGDAEGLGGWSAGDIAYYLESGFTPDFDMVGSSMVEVQENMARLPAADREAIAAYLKAVTGVSSGQDE